jgi:hypothetical protein
MCLHQIQGISLASAGRASYEKKIHMYFDGEFELKIAIHNF